MVLKNVCIRGELTDITVTDGIIADIGKTTASGTDFGGKRIVPGLVDIHSHGCIGLDTMDADFKEMCAFYAGHGTTSWFPTTLTASRESLKKVTSASTDFPGARIRGFHLEGPYINVKYKGAQNEDFIRNPSVSEFEGFENVKMISLAPELPGAVDFIKSVSKKCVISLGHTDCDYETAVKAADAGAVCLTHTFNAMPPLHHRNPGPIGAAIEKNMYAQFICDGLHISKPVIVGAYRTFGPDRMILISDSIRSACLPDGEYDSGGLRVFMKNGQCRLADGKLAGSSVMLWDCVKTAVSFGIPFDDAVRMASQTPAELMGLDCGRIEKGYDADFLIIDDDMEILSVIIGGKYYIK